MTKDLGNWQPCPLPGDKVLEGVRVRLEPYVPAEHAQALHELLCNEENREIWAYIPFGPFDDAGDFRAAYEMAMSGKGWRPLVITDPESTQALGMYSFMRLRPGVGSAEIGAVLYSKKLQRTAAATEAFYLGTRHIFEDCGYRRYEWKCNSRNEASCRAAVRYGFTFEGRFRQDMIVKGQNRDTDWYSMLDHEWPVSKQALEAWLKSENFDEAGQQRQGLKTFRESLAAETGKK